MPQSLPYVCPVRLAVKSTASTMSDNDRTPIVVDYDVVGRINSSVISFAAEAIARAAHAAAKALEASAQRTVRRTSARPRSSRSRSSQPRDPRPRSPQLKEPRPRSPQPRDPRPSSPQPRDPRPRSPQPRDPRPSSPQPRDPRPRSPQPRDPRPSSPRNATDHIVSVNDAIVDPNPFPVEPVLLTNFIAEVSYIDECTNVYTMICPRMLLLFGELSGLAVLVIPWAVISLNWIGLAMLAVVAILTIYCGSCMGICWEILNERYYLSTEFSTRDTYEQITYETFGYRTGVFLNSCLITSLFGASTVFMMLMSQSAHQLFIDVHPQIDYNIWMVIFALLLSALMLLESPRNSRSMAVGTLLTSMSAGFLIIIQMILDHKKNEIPVVHHYKEFNIDQFVISYGTMLFAFGSASSFPTIQNRMFKTPDFSKSLNGTFLILSALFFGIVGGSFFVYGDGIQQNILLSLGHSWVSRLAIFLVILHLMLGFLTTMDPIAQRFERYLEIREYYMLKKFLIRAFLLLGMLILGQIVHKCNILITLIGSSTIALATFVLPPMFYLIFCAMEKRETWPIRIITWPSKICLYVAITISLSGMIIVGLSAISNLINMQLLIDFITSLYTPSNSKTNYII